MIKENIIFQSKYENEIPNKEWCEEYNIYFDKNYFEWIIAITKDGFYLKYMGDKHFKETYFDIIINDSNVLIKNTGCFFVKSKNFNIFYEIRNIINDNYTDDIWENVENFIQNRFNNSEIILDCEKVDI